MVTYARRRGTYPPHRRSGGPPAGRWGGNVGLGAGAGSGNEPVYGALDLGTNNCRLLVARPDGRSFEVIDSFSRIVRLGEGLQASGRLSEAAIERTIAALHVCAAKLRRRGVTRLRSVATEACRLAANCDDFVARVEDETGLRLEIINTAEEARLAASGCAPLLRRDQDRALVFDIGGGSSEVMWIAVPPDGQGGAPEVLDSVSVPWGVVKMAERWGGDTITPAVYAAMVEEIRNHLVPFEARHRIGREIVARRVQMQGSSGTVTTLAGIHLALPRYQRSAVDGQFLSFAQVSAVTDRLRSMDYGARAAHPCVGPERADLVVAGCAILAAICLLWPIGVLRVADRGVREGILFSLMAADGVGHGGGGHRNGRPLALNA